MTMKLSGVVKSLWRYPVKSMSGETCTSLVVNNRGVVGDRWFAITDEQGKFGSGKNTRRFVKIDGLLEFRAAYDGGVPVITFPDGKSVRGDDPSVHSRLTEALDRPVTLAEEQSVPHFDNDSIHLVTTSSLDWLRSKLPGAVIDERRFRPNVLIQTEGSGLVEQGWVGRTVRIGRGVVLEVTQPTERCVMTNFGQPGIPEDKSVFACVGREAELKFGVYARVVSTGEVSLGEGVEVI